MLRIEFANKLGGCPDEKFWGYCTLFPLFLLLLGKEAGGELRYWPQPLQLIKFCCYICSKSWGGDRCEICSQGKEGR